MTRAVLDTNILVSALIKRPGTQYRIVSHANSRFVWLTSEFILKEATTVFSRPRIRKKYPEQTTIARQKRYLELVRRTAEIVKVKTALTTVSDATDNQVLACAIDGRADYLATGDHHLLELKRFRRVKIIKPSAFLDMLNVSTLRGSVNPPGTRVRQ